MKCEKCQHRLPDDSRFCQYCGAVIATVQETLQPAAEEKPVITASAAVPPVPQTATVPQMPPVPTSYARPIHVRQQVPTQMPIANTQPSVAQGRPNGKRRFCSICGGQIDNNTKKCTKCGKQYFKGLALDSTKVMTLLLLVFVLAALCVGLCVHYEERLAEETAYYEDQISEYQAQILELEKLNEENKELFSQDLHESLESYMKGTVIKDLGQFVNDEAYIYDETYLHKCSCPNIDYSGRCKVYGIDSTWANKYPKCNTCC